MPKPFVPPAHESLVPTQSVFPSFDDEVEAAAQFEDQLLPTAVEIFLTENRASVSLLQRRLRIGYTRSARLVDQLTDMGIVTLETEGQSRKINRAVAEALLQSLHPEENDF
jgi:DNA segregation ATPase FtsK/SpoIIIE-like protein